MFDNLGENYVCGINWELTESRNEFSWWDTTDIKKTYPCIDEQQNKQQANKLSALAGIHYNERNVIGIPSGAKMLDSTQIDLPTLVRTDIAHTVAYHRDLKFSNLYNFNSRVSLSVRFDPQWSTWEEACDFFKSVIL